ncbi:GNAT family N-acetyltransferase [Streptomyces rimosus]|uniref:GNAT family N-acetyltransferase n=1 Tax=Streptomyces rimosus TaxID=1927 RepID=UPI00131B213E
MALRGHAAIIDQFTTEPPHRRRALGCHAMQTLTHHATTNDATLGVLSATDAGRALYETLGWKTYAPLAACVYRP